MKKILLCCTIVSLVLTSCRKDDTPTTPEVDITTQNTYDDQAAQKFLNDNYLDDKGNIKAFSDTDTSDDNKPKLSTYNPVTLPSGVIYIKIPNSQPTNGTPIGSTDIIRLMQNTITYIATKDDAGVVKFTSGYGFVNNIAGSGVPDVDPPYYYIKQSILDADTSKPRSYYEIEGLKEGLSYFQSFNMADSDDYKMQGIIIVPSRAAFARDNHFAYTLYSFKDRSFVFNFQVYKTSPRN